MTGVFGVVSNGEGNGVKAGVPTLPSSSSSKSIVSSNLRRLVLGPISKVEKKGRMRTYEDLLVEKRLEEWMEALAICG
jgi:hypothetical protein